MSSCAFASAENFLDQFDLDNYRVKEARATVYIDLESIILTGNPRGVDALSRQEAIKCKFIDFQLTYQNRA